MAGTKTVRLFQLLLAVLIVVAAVRLVIVLAKRAGPGAEPAKTTAAPPLPREAYVVPKRLYISSMTSAEQLTQQPVWTKEGFRYTVYPFANGKADFQHRAGMLLPIQKLQVKEVASVPMMNNKNRQIVAVFDQDGKTFAVPIGLQSGTDFTFYPDEMFYYEDPHELFKFWPAEIWQAIDRHEAQNGMNEYQVAFAIGMGVPQPVSEFGKKTVNYPNGGKPLVVTYQSGKAIEIKPGKP